MWCLVAELPQQAPDGIGGLLHFGVDLFGAGFGVGLGGGPHDAVADVLLNESQADGVKGLGGGGYLGQDVDAVFVILHHAGNPADLALNPFQAFEVGVLIAGVPMGSGVLQVHLDDGCIGVAHAQVWRAHALKLYPQGVLSQVPPGGIAQK